MQDAEEEEQEGVLSGEPSLERSLANLTLRIRSIGGEHVADVVEQEVLVDRALLAWNEKAVVHVLLVEREPEASLGVAT
jgi:hypothetical protein